jgi:hypothetical protein
MNDEEIEAAHIAKVKSREWRVIGNKHRRRKLRKRGEAVRWSRFVGWFWIPGKPDFGYFTDYKGNRL